MLWITYKAIKWLMWSLALMSRRTWSWPTLVSAKEGRHLRIRSQNLAISTKRIRQERGTQFRNCGTKFERSNLSESPATLRHVRSHSLKINNPRPPKHPENNYLRAWRPHAALLPTISSPSFNTFERHIRHTILYV